MKVLFAVTSDSVSDAIVKKYQREYKEILSYKNVYYFNAILKEIQKDKSYDRIVISEDLEAFANSNYDAIDKFIFEKLDNISDEAQDIDGNETSVILICTDRHTRGSSFLVKLFSIGIYNALLGSERSMEQVCRLINKPRVKKEAKNYYGIDAEDANYSSNNSDEVSELEIQNILTHFKKLGKNTDKFTDSFNNIAQQYSDDQLKIVINCLPVNVKAVLEDECKKYQELVSVNGVISRVNRDRMDTKEAEKQTGIKIDMIENKKNAKMSGPIVIPGAVRTSKNKGPQPVRPMGNNVDKSLLSDNESKVKKVVSHKPDVSETEAILEKKVQTANTVQTKQAAPARPAAPVKPVAETRPATPVKQTEPAPKPAAKPVEQENKPKKVKSTEGLIKKVKPDGTVVYVRPKVKTPEAQETKTVKPAAPVKPVVEETKKVSKPEEKEELDDLVLPSMNDFEKDNLVLPEKNDDLDNLDLPGIDLVDDEDEDILPGIDDDETPSLGGLDEDDDLILPSKNDDFDDFDDIDVPSLDDFDAEGNEIPKEKTKEIEDGDDEELDLSSIEEDSDDDELGLPSIEEDSDDDELELPSIEGDSDDEELELPSIEEDSDDDGLDLSEVEEDSDDEELELPSIEEDDDGLELSEVEDEVDDDGLDLPEVEEDTLIPLTDLGEEEEIPTLEEDDELVEVDDSEEIPGLDDFDDDGLDLPPVGGEFDDEYTEEVDIPGLDSIDDFDLEDSNTSKVNDLLPDDDEPLVSTNIAQETTKVQAPELTQEIESIKPRVDYSMSSLNSLLTKDKKIVTFLGTTKNGTSFLINNLASLFSSLGISTAILDMTKNRNSYYIYTNNDENLRNIAYNSMSKLQKGFAEGIKVDKNLTVYSALPNDGKDYSDAEPILSTLVQNHSLILIDCDFDTDPSYFASCQEIYLVQSMDILTIQPLTSFLRDLKSQGVLEAEKVRVVINKELKVKSLSSKAILGGMSFYNDPSMSFMTELFNKEMVKWCSIPFEDAAYSKYLDAMVNCNVSINGYSKQFMNKLRNLGDMVYPLVSKSSSYGSTKSQASAAPKFGKTAFSKDTNNTLNQMKKKI